MTEATAAAPLGAPSRRDRNRHRVVERILAAAEERFRATGLHGATLEDIASSADVSVGTLYNHFGSKEGLYLASVERAIDANRAYMDLAYRDDLRPIEQVLAAADAYLLFHLEHPGYFQMVALPAATGGSPELDGARERIADRVRTEVDRFAACVQRAMDAGELRDGDAVTAATFMWGAWNGVVALSQRPDRLRLRSRDIQRVLEVGRRMVLEGLASDAVRGPDGGIAPHVRMPRARELRRQPR